MASSYIHRTNSSGSGTTATVSFWAKLNQVTADGGLVQFYTDNNNFMGIYANPTVKFRTYISSSYGQGDMRTYIQHRDPAAWYHYVMVFDTTNATAADRMRLWINGVRVVTDEMNTPENPSASYSFTPLVSGSFQINRYNGNSTYSDHIYSHVHYCDGYAYDASTFGEFDSTSGIWKIKTGPSVSYGTNGVFLKMEDSSNLDLDSSPNAHTMTTVGTVTATKDNPSDNFCTMNPLDAQSSNGAGINYANGNTQVTDGDSNWRSSWGTLGESVGKYYYEAKVLATSTNWGVGICDVDQVVKGETKFWATSDGYGTNASTQKCNSGAEDAWGGISIAQNDIVQCALDLDNAKIYFGKNGTWIDSGDPTSGATGTGAAFTINTGGRIYLPAWAGYGTAAIMAFNFGNGYFATTAISSEGTNASGIGSFEYDVPTGYTAWTTKGFNV